VVMGKKYNQLKIDERGMIAVLRAEGKSAREIFKRHSEIYRSVIEGDTSIENLDTEARVITLQIKGLNIVKIPY